MPKDEEALKEWKKWIDEDRIPKFGKKDNFWEMGETVLVVHAQKYTGLQVRRRAKKTKGSSTGEQG